MLRYAAAQVATALCRSIAPKQAPTLPSISHIPPIIMTIRTCKKKSAKDKGKEKGKKKDKEEEECDEDEKKGKNEKKGKTEKKGKNEKKAEDKKETIIEIEGPHGVPTTEKEITAFFVKYFDRCDIDGWELRQGMNNLMGMDLIIDPPIIISALHACRRNNDIALAIRWLEVCKEKCAGDMKIAYPYIMKEIKPTLQELGVPTLEELHYDEPELALESVYNM